MSLEIALARYLARHPLNETANLLLPFNDRDSATPAPTGH